MQTDLIELIEKGDKDEICTYLSEVTTNDFKQDVANLIKRVADKGAIKTAIEKLQELL